MIVENRYTTAAGEMKGPRVDNDPVCIPEKKNRVVFASNAWNLLKIHRALLYRVFYDKLFSYNMVTPSPTHNRPALPVYVLWRATELLLPRYYSRGRRGV